MNEELRMREDWVECTLDDLLVLMTNGSSAKQFKENIGLPISRIETIWNETIDFERVKYIKENDEDFIEKYKLKKNDILLSHINSDNHLGKTAIYKDETRTLIHGINLLKLRPSKQISADLLLHQFRFKKIKGDFIAVAQRAVNQSSINQRKLKVFDFILPPLVEQKAIVNKIEELFSSLDSGIADLKKAQKQLVVYRQAVLKKSFEGFKEVPFEEIITSSQNGISKRRGSEGKEIKVLRLADITKLAIDNSSPRSILLNDKELDKYKLCEGDLLAIRVNGSIDLVGRFVHISNKDETEVWAFCDHLIRVKLDKKISEPKFYYYYLQIPEVRKFIHENMVSSAGQNTVSQSTVKSISVPVASIEEQHQIVSDIENRLSVCDTVEKDIAYSLEKAQALRQSILKQAFEGKLLSEAEIAQCKAHKDYEPASVLLERIKNEKI